jgi:hypothetical protein
VFCSILQTIGCKTLICLFAVQFSKSSASRKKNILWQKNDLQRFGCKTLICLSAEIFLQTIGCKMLICLFAKLFFAQFYKRLVVKPLFAYLLFNFPKVVPRKKKYFLAKKDLQRIGCKTLICLFAEIFLQTIDCEMIICLFAKLCFVQFYKRLAVKPLFAYLRFNFPKVVPRKKNIFWQKIDLQRIGCKTLLCLSAKIFLQIIGCKTLIWLFAQKFFTIDQL